MNRTKLVALYEAPRDHAILVLVPDEVFISVDGRGSPHGPAFQGAIRTLYAVASAVRGLLKETTGARVPPVGPLEALWWWTGDTKTFPVAKEKEWRWRLMIQQPPEATPSLVKRAVAMAREKGPDLSLDLVEHRHLEEGTSLQIMHVGPYRSEAPTLARLHDEMYAAGFEPAGLHHEIYLSDPRRTKPESLRTLLRQPVRPARQ